MSHPVLVLGGGPAGLATALCLSACGVPCTLVDAGGDPADDKRTSALMGASVELLRRLGVWDACETQAAPLRRLRIVDDTGRLPRAPTVEFDAEEIGEPEFGWNVPNAVLVEALRKRLGTDGAIGHVTGKITSLDLAEDGVTALLEDGSRHDAQLAVGADGRNSMARTAAGIRADEWSYDQAALVTTFAHTRPHREVSTEFHRAGGPFTLVPLPGNRSSLVWVESRRLAETYGIFDNVSIAAEIERLSHRLLGRVTIDGPRAVIPLAGLNARRYGAKRVLLVGEAAHVMPPIGAQGLNLGLRDAAAAAEAVAEAWHAGADVGGEAVTRAYDRARRVDIISRTGVIDMLNRTLLGSFMPVQAARAAGLAAMAMVGPVRRFAMREGIAPRIGLPRLMRREGVTETDPSAARLPSRDTSPSSG